MGQTCAVRKFKAACPRVLRPGLLGLLGQDLRQCFAEIAKIVSTKVEAEDEVEAAVSRSSDSEVVEQSAPKRARCSIS